MTKDIEIEIQEAFHEEAHNQGFCLDQKWSNCDNPYLDHDTHLAYEFYKDGWKAAKAHEAEKLKGCVVVPESELKDTFYWPDSEYVVDCPFDYDFELDKGEIQAIEKWKRTKSTKIYFANIYKDEESFEIKEFPSLEAAQEAVKENNAYLEAEEFFNLAEAARGGNE